MKRYGFPVKHDPFDTQPRWDYAKHAAPEAVEAIAPFPEPKMDEELFKLKQIYNIIFAQFQAAELAASAAARVVDHTRKGLKEISDRIAVREIQLGKRPMSESDSVEEPWEGA